MKKEERFPEDICMPLSLKFTPRPRNIKAKYYSLQNSDELL